MILHDCTTAPSPRRVRMFLAEKGIQIEMRQVDLSTGEQFSAEIQKAQSSVRGAIARTG